MNFEGKEYKRDFKGFYRCPYGCSDPRYSARKFVGEERFLKHLQECRAKPSEGQELVWVPPEKSEPKYFQDCPDCGLPIFETETIWWLRDKIVCMQCYRPYFEVGRGHQEPVNLQIPGITLEG